MIGYLTIGTNDLDRTIKFYGPLLARKSVASKKWLLRHQHRTSSDPSASGRKVRLAAICKFSGFGPCPSGTASTCILQ